MSRNPYFGGKRAVFRGLIGPPKSFPTLLTRFMPTFLNYNYARSLMIIIMGMTFEWIEEERCSLDQESFFWDWNFSRPAGFY
jgi:hypothetical protein